MNVGKLECILNGLCMQVSLSQLMTAYPFHCGQAEACWTCHLLIYGSIQANCLPRAGVPPNVHALVKGGVDIERLLAAYVAGARQPYQFTADLTAILCQYDIRILLNASLTSNTSNQCHILDFIKFHIK